MRTLALEFSTSLRSAALVEEGQVIGFAREETPQTMGPARLTREVMGQSGMKPSDVHRIAVGLGPGSYTGVRVAIAVAQGWELARGVGLIGISSVECLAWRAWLDGEHGDTSILVDAQRGECYVARYRLSPLTIELIEPLALRSNEEAGRLAAQGSRLMGPDMARCVPGVTTAYPEASMLGVLACDRHDLVHGAELQPIYLRDTEFVKAPTPRIVAAAGSGLNPKRERGQ